MNATAETPAVETLPLLSWRCGNCAARLAGRPRLLARFTALGGVRVVWGRHGVRGGCALSREILLDLHAATIGIHCPACHEWEGLCLDRETGLITATPWRGARPDDAACR